MINFAECDYFWIGIGNCRKLFIHFSHGNKAVQDFFPHIKPLQKTFSTVLHMKNSNKEHNAFQNSTKERMTHFDITITVKRYLDSVKPLYNGHLYKQTPAYNEHFSQEWIKWRSNSHNVKSLWSGRFIPK